MVNTNLLIGMDDYIKSVRLLVLNAIKQVNYHDPIEFFNALKKHIYTSYFNKYGSYNIYLYFANKIESDDNTYNILTPEEFENQITKKVNSELQSKQFDRIGSKIINHLLDKQMLEKCDPIQLYDNIMILMDPKKEDISSLDLIPYKLRVLEHVRKVSGIELPSKDIDIIVFEIASEICKLCNNDYKDVESMVLLIKSITEQTLDISEYKEFKKLSGIVLVEVTKLISKLYNPKITLESLDNFETPNYSSQVDGDEYNADDCISDDEGLEIE